MLGLYRVGYTDGLGVRHYALRGIRELSSREFTEMFRASPWKVLQSAGSLAAKVDEHNDAIEAEGKPDFTAIHEEAFDFWKHKRRKVGL